MKFDLRTDDESISIVKSLMEAGCFFLLMIDGSPFVDVLGFAELVFRENGLPLYSFSKDDDLEEVKRNAAEDRTRLLVVPDCMDNTIGELIQAGTPFAVVINKLKVHEEYPFAEYDDILKLKINIDLCGRESRINGLKGCFGEQAALVHDMFGSFKVPDEKMYVLTDQVKAILESGGNIPRKLFKFLTMQGYVPKMTPQQSNKPVGTLEDNEPIEIMKPMVSGQFNPGLLKSSTPVSILERMVNMSDGKGFRLLLCGGSGTGKTAFAHYLAKHLNRKIIVAKPSQIFQKWWGNTERNISRMFETAQKTGAVLLFDEIDAYLGKRGDSTEVNQKHWTTIVNMFLQEMERFIGIMIGTTNMKDNVDTAFIRRFHRIVEFEFPDRATIARLWHVYFPDYEISDKDLDALSEPETLGPGDFANLWDTCRFMEEGEVNTEFLVSELERVTQLRGGRKHRQMGFRV